MVFVLMVSRCTSTNSEMESIISSGSVQFSRRRKTDMAWINASLQITTGASELVAGNSAFARNPCFLRWYARIQTPSRVASSSRTNGPSRMSTASSSDFAAACSMLTMRMRMGLLCCGSNPGCMHQHGWTLDDTSCFSGPRDNISARTRSSWCSASTEPSVNHIRWELRFKVFKLEDTITITPSSSTSSTRREPAGHSMRTTALPRVSKRIPTI